MLSNQLSLSKDNIPDVPTFDIEYNDKDLKCYPIRVIKKKYYQDRVEYYCINRDIKISDNSIVDDIDKEHGQIDTEQLITASKDKIDQGAIYKVDILLSDAKSGYWSAFMAKQQLNKKNRLLNYIDILLPAKYYISLRPQLGNNGSKKGMKFRDGGSRGGFFYYKEFGNQIEIMSQYEAGISFNSDVPFINISDGDNSSRRLSYISLIYHNESIVIGKYWSTYYDIASFTDYFMAFGAQASGAFNNLSDGGDSGTGRPDRVIQIKTKHDRYKIKLQFQPTHLAPENIDTEYQYSLSSSIIYKYSDYLYIGASIAYAKFDNITEHMADIGIDGNDQSYILGFTYKRDRYSINSIVSYTKNHMNDDLGIYFDSIGTELYLQYDISDSIRIAGGSNIMLPTSGDYLGSYSIKTNILSLQYTFGAKTYDDLIYIEVSTPRGRLSNGDTLDLSVAIGLRYLFGR
jgi:predicted porin